MTLTEVETAIVRYKNISTQIPKVEKALRVLENPSEIRNHQPRLEFESTTIYVSTDIAEMLFVKALASMKREHAALAKSLNITVMEVLS